MLCNPSYRPRKTQSHSNQVPSASRLQKSSQQTSSLESSSFRRGLASPGKKDSQLRRKKFRRRGLQCRMRDWSVPDNFAVRVIAKSEQSLKIDTSHVTSNAYGSLPISVASPRTQRLLYHCQHSLLSSGTSSFQSTQGLGFADEIF